MHPSSKNKKPNAEAVENFWKWFTKNEKTIREVLDDDTHPERNSIVNSLDNYILEFGMFTWEVGPAKTKPFYLTISPNGDKELLIVSKKIIQSAPQLTDWEFNASKPVKEWDLKFSLYDNNMLEREVDASGWNFVAHRLPNNGMKIIIEAENVSHLDEDTKKTAADLVVTGLLGEEKKINSVTEIFIVPQFEEENKSRSQAIQSLSKHF